MQRDPYAPSKFVQRVSACAVYARAYTSAMPNSALAPIATLVTASSRSSSSRDPTILLNDGDELDTALCLLVFSCSRDRLLGCQWHFMEFFFYVTRFVISFFFLSIYPQATIVSQKIAQQTFLMIQYPPNIELDWHPHKSTKPSTYSHNENCMELQ